MWVRVPPPALLDSNSKTKATTQVVCLGGYRHWFAYPDMSTQIARVRNWEERPNALSLMTVFTAGLAFDGIPVTLSASVLFFGIVGYS